MPGLASRKKNDNSELIELSLNDTLSEMILFPHKIPVRSKHLHERCHLTNVIKSNMITLSK